MPISTDHKRIKEIMSRGVERIIKRDSLERKLKSGKKLRIKLGIDPTGPDIHIGRAIQLWKLREFQELGHQVVIILGDFTAQIGDASDKTSMRKPLSKRQVEENLRGYRKQIGKILDLRKTEIRRNSEWAKKLTLEKFLPLAKAFTAQQMIQRRNFKERWEKSKPIGVQELLYPILQGYDSVQVRADVEIGGYDQLFNLKTGREIQKMFGQAPQDIIVLKMLYGLDGRKMSTSWGNVITILENPTETYGKIMSMKDNLIIDYFRLCTRLPEQEIKKIESGIKKKKVNPRDAKARLAREVVELYHGKSTAKRAEGEFERVFREKRSPSKIPKFSTRNNFISLINLLNKSGLAASKNEAKRLVAQNGVRINGVIQRDWKKNIKLKNGMIIQAGKRKFRKIRLES